MIQSLRAYLFIFVLSMFNSYAHAGQRQCLSDIDARAQVQLQKLISIDKALVAARLKIKGDLISASLCQISGGFIYQIAIISFDGHVVKIMIDASNGKIIE